MAAFGVFVVEEGQAHLFHSRGEFAGVLGADAVVFRGGENQGLGISDVRVEVVVGRGS